jgi:flagellar protein FliO/FliZ
MTFDPALAALIGVLVAAVSGLHWWTRARAARTDGPIRILASQALGAKRALALVEVDDARLLLGVTDEQVSCLARLEPRTAAAPALRRVAGSGEVS